jgi:hypothetical protein
MTVAEPPRPERGRSAEERGREVSEAQANPKFLLSQANGYPTGIKQFLQLCLIIVYPAWLLLVLIAWPLWLVGKLFEGILWVLFWPVRALHKKNNPEEYAAYQAEQKAKKEAAQAAHQQAKQG